MFAFFWHQVSVKYFSPTLLHRLFGLLFLCFSAIVSAGSKPDNITETEMALLPRYCMDTEAFKYGPQGATQSPRAAHWERLMGHGFWSLHHACYAKIYMLRSYRSGVSAATQRNMRENARSEYLYVIKNTPDDFVLLPEIYTGLGQLELQLLRYNYADIAFTKARKLKPDYWPAYSHWADYLIKTGKKLEAKELLKAGLEYSPQAKVLIDLYQRVGGKLSEIIPKTVDQTNEAVKAEITEPIVE
jgi:tetratricopeptide (TPR) repeat protein